MKATAGNFTNNGMWTVSLSFSRESWLGYQTVLRNTSAAIKDVHLIRIFHRFHMLTWHAISMGHQFIHSHACSGLDTHTNYTCGCNWLSLFFHRDRPICKQLSLLDIESCFNTGLVGSHNVPKVLCQTCKTCIKISQPYIGHLRWKQISSPNVNWLYSPNIKQNHMGNIEIQIEVT